MSSFSIWHWLITLFVMGGPILVIVLIVWLIKKIASPSTPVAPSSPATQSVEARLLALQTLREKGLISAAEHEQKRLDVLKSA
jgi:hypothetical protein